MSEVLLSLRDVTRAYPQAAATPLTVLRGASLDLRAGEMVALVGPSGSGKSTLLHIAGLLDQPTEGQVSVLGEDLSNAGDALRTRRRRETIGFVYQFHHLLPEFTATENLILPQMLKDRPKAEARKRASALLQAVGLQHRERHRPSQLSGGEQQRLAVARALVNQPRILLADEPTGNLDEKTSDTVFEIIRALVREARIAALIATHNLDLAGRMDRILEMRDGVVSER